MSYLGLFIMIFTYTQLSLPLLFSFQPNNIHHSGKSPGGMNIA